MDPTVPKGAAVLLRFVYEAETGKTPPECYEVIYKHKQHTLAKPLTRMTLDEVVAAQAKWSKNYGSSAAGAPQFIRATLRGLMAELGLRGSQIFDPDLQDRLAYHLLKRRGYEDFVTGKISMVAFAKNLACEWASLPVLTTTKGQSRTVERGQSYYAGDGLNKALVSPEKVEAILKAVLQAEAPASAQKPSSRPEPSPPSSRSSSGLAGGILAAIFAAFAAAVYSAWDAISNFLSSIIGG